MSRYTGPRVRTMRALGTELPGLSRKKIERRPFPPGQHGPDAEAKKATVSDLPDPSSVPFPINVQRVVEFYSQRT